MMDKLVGPATLVYVASAGFAGLWWASSSRAGGTSATAAGA